MKICLNNTRTGVTNVSYRNGATVIYSSSSKLWYLHHHVFHFPLSTRGLQVELEISYLGYSFELMNDQAKSYLQVRNLEIRMIPWMSVTSEGRIKKMVANKPESKIKNFAEHVCIYLFRCYIQNSLRTNVNYSPFTVCFKQNKCLIIS